MAFLVLLERLTPVERAVLLFREVFDYEYSRDVVLHSDGGSKTIAVPHLIYGADNVACAILGGLRKLVPKNLARRMTQINGEPGVVSYLNGQPYSVITLDAGEGRIRAIYILTNPQKLSHLPELPATPC